MTSYVTFIPLGKRLLVKRIQSEATGKLMLLDSSKDKDRAIILRLGTEPSEEIRVGQTILINKYTGQEVRLGAETYLLIKNEDVLGILEE